MPELSEPVAHHGSAPSRPFRVVVLGATGSVGTSLMQGFSTQAIDAIGLGSAQVNLCDPSSVDLLRQMIRPDDTLLILSALTPDKGRDVSTFMKNVTMGAHLSLFLQQGPCAHVIYLSSDAVYADGVSPIRETSCASPSTLHGLMHLARERLLQEALRSSKTPLLILRPCTLYGPSDTHNGYGPNRFLRSAIREHTISLFGEGEEQRDHLYLDDLSRLIGLCAQQRTSGLLNVATGTAVSFAAVAEMVAGLLDAPVQITSRPRQGPITHRRFDVTALQRAFPSWRATPFSEGLPATYRRWMEETEVVG